MKIKKQFFNTKLTKLKLLESRIYPNKFNTSLKNTETIYNFKKACTIIYKYHIYRKKILFVGKNLTSKFNFRKLLRGSNHHMLPKSVWTNGIITNRAMRFQYLNKNKKTVGKKSYKYLSELNLRFDLIVILDSDYKKNIIKECYQSYTPVIFLGDCLTNEHAKFNYNIPISFPSLETKVRNKFFYLLLFALLKKLKRTKYKREKFKDVYQKTKIKGKTFVQNYHQKKRKYRKQNQTFKV
jgi:ribosomal protein S2